MKTIINIAVLIVFAYIQMFNGMIWMSYEINKSEIIQQFCVNKEKPELKCEGTCHMKKMMLTDEAEEEGEPILVLPQIQLFLNDFGIDLLNSEIEIYQRDTYSNLYSFKFLDDWEIPPKA